MRRGSPTISAAENRGFIAAAELWKTSCIWRRAANKSAEDKVRRFLSSNQISPESGSNNRARHRARVDLPEPDSPTRATVERECTAKLTSSREATRNLLRENHLPCTYCFLRCRALNKGARWPLAVELSAAISETTYSATVPHLHFFGLPRPANLHALRATRFKRAALSHVRKIGRHTCDSG